MSACEIRIMCVDSKLPQNGGCDIKKPGENSKAYCYWVLFYCVATCLKGCSWVNGTQSAMGICWLMKAHSTWGQPHHRPNWTQQHRSQWCCTHICWQQIWPHACRQWAVMLEQIWKRTTLLMILNWDHWWHSSITALVPGVREGLKWNVMTL